MKNQSPDTKERILSTVVELLLDRKDVNQLTTREIARLANVNGASINYYYQSKDNLVLKAVEVVMESMAKKLFDKDMKEKDQVGRLKTMIKEIAAFSFNNYYLSEIAISAELKKGSINTSQIILPLLQDIFKESKTSSELKVMAMQIIAPMQVMFLNASQYKDYLAVDVFNEEVRNELLDKMVDQILKECNES